MDKPTLIHGPTGPYGLGYLMCTAQYQDGTIKTMTWHKFIYESNYGKLEDGFCVHHKNHNKNDNRIENLEAISNSNHAKHHAKPIEILALICQWCGNEFSTKARNYRGNRKRGKFGPFCGRSCAGKWSREKQLGRL